MNTQKENSHIKIILHVRNCKLIMIHLYIQTLADSYDPSGIQIITPRMHTHTSLTPILHSLSLTHTHTQTYTLKATGLSLFSPSVCMHEMSIMLRVKDVDIRGINKRWHQNSFLSFFWHKTELCASFSGLLMFPRYFMRRLLEETDYFQITAVARTFYLYFST